MNTLLNLLLLTAVLLAPFVLVAAIASRTHRNGYLRWHFDQFRLAAPVVGRLYDDDADSRRIDHHVDAIRTRFERQPAWPDSGARGERR
jgi:hypothetical protein